MGSRTKFEDLKIWQKSQKLAVDIYNLTNGDKFKKDFGLRDQMRRAAVSIPSNIAEGDERSSNADSVRFFFMAKGSVAELRTQLRISMDINYIPKELFLKLDAELVEIAKMLWALINVRKK